ncbi:MAG: hypothetical protein GF401_07610 [Chitinivibrionales bacterium]|nr:hypothetical protein [Chitinivibrionales bacterium]
MPLLLHIGHHKSKILITLFCVNTHNDPPRFVSTTRSVFQLGECAALPDLFTRPFSRGTNSQKMLFFV